MSTRDFSTETPTGRKSLLNFSSVFMLPFPLSLKSRRTPVFILFYFFFLFYNHTSGIWKLPSQGLNLNSRCALHSSCGNAESFNPLPWTRDQTPCLSSDPSCCSRLLNPVYHSGNPLPPGLSSAFSKNVRHQVENTVNIAVKGMILG